MYSLFNTQGRERAGQIVIPNFKNVREKLQHDINNIITYYRDGSFVTGSDHILLKLIIAVGVPLSYDLDRYYEVVQARVLRACNAVGISTSLSPGKWHTGIFYNDCLEFILGYSGEHLPYLAIKDWKNLSPLKVITHPVSHMGYLLPDGKKNNLETGLSVLSVDVPLLMLQYRGFLQDQYSNNLIRENGDKRALGIRHMLMKYTIPNAIYSHVDYLLFNRCYNLFYGKPMGMKLRKYPFYISDYTASLDSGLEVMIERIASTRLLYRDILLQLPSVYSDYPYLNPDIAETKQVYWALFLSRLKVMTFLFDLSSLNRTYNRVLLNELKIDIKHFRSDNIFNSVLPVSLRDDVNYDLNRMWKDL